MRLTIKQAAEIMNVGEQQLRIMIQRGKIPGAFYGGSKERRSYFITREQVERLMRGEI